MGVWPETDRVGCVSEHYGRYIRLLCSGCLVGARGVCLRSHDELSFGGYCGCYASLARCCDCRSVPGVVMIIVVQGCKVARFVWTRRL